MWRCHLDAAEVLLVGLGVAGVLVEHVGRARLHLRLEDCEPQLLRLDRLARLKHRRKPARKVSDAFKMRFRGTSTVGIRTRQNSTQPSARTCCVHSKIIVDGGAVESYLALRFVLGVESLELLAPAVAEARALVRAEQRPVRVRLDPGARTHATTPVSNEI